MIDARVFRPGRPLDDTASAAGIARLSFFLFLVVLLVLPVPALFRGGRHVTH